MVFPLGTFKRKFGFALKIRLALLGLLSVLAAIGCRDRENAGGKASSQSEIRIGTLFTALDYAPYYVARENGWLDDALKGKAKVVHLETFQSLPSSNEAMAADKVDVVLTADVPAIVARASGVKVRLPMLSCTLNSQVVVHPGANPLKLSQMKGKRMAVVFGTGPHYGLLQRLKEQGLEPPSVELVDMTPPDAKAAFQSKAIDGWAIFPPFVEQEVIAGTGAVLEGVTSPVQVVVSVREAFMQRNPEAVKAALDVLQQAKNWIRENPEKAQELMSKQLDLELPVVQLGWKRLDWSASIEDENVQKDLQDKAGFLTDRGYIKQKVEVAFDMLQDPGP